MEGCAKTREKNKGEGTKTMMAKNCKVQIPKKQAKSKRIENGETSEKTERGGDEIRIRKRYMKCCPQPQKEHFYTLKTTHPLIKTVHMPQESGFAWQKSQGLHAIEVGSYAIFSVKVPCRFRRARDFHAIRPLIL